MSEENDLLQCCRCRNKHLHSERAEKKGDVGYISICPRCSAESYYNLSEQERIKLITLEKP